MKKEKAYGVFLLLSNLCNSKLTSTRVAFVIVLITVALVWIASSDWFLQFHDLFTVVKLFLFETISCIVSILR